MAHHIKFKMPAMQVENSDITIEVSSKDPGSQPRKMGSLKVSKGNIEWIPRDHSTTRYQLSWTNFADMMSSQGKKVSRRKK